MPPIERYMSRGVISIAPGAPITAAHAMMRDHKLRHLPVIDDGKVVGILCASDLYHLEATASVDPHATYVREAMTENVFAVPSSAPLDEVVRAMNQRHCSSAMVVGPTGLEGIFTSVDALDALADVLDRAVA